MTIYIYILFGKLESYYVASIQSLLNYARGCSVLIFTDNCNIQLNPKSDDVEIIIVPIPKWISRLQHYQKNLFLKVLAAYEIVSNKYVYLDADTYVRADISDLFNIEFKDKIFAGAKAEKWINSHCCEEIYNAGVLIVNATGIRTKYTKNALIAEIEKYPNLTDEDIFNIVFKENVMPFDGALPNLSKYNNILWESESNGCLKLETSKIWHFCKYPQEILKLL